MNKSKLKEQSDRLFRLHMEITGFYNECAKSKGLTLTALKVLHIIYKNPNCNQQVITQLTYLPKQTVNAIIKTFVKQGITELKTDTDKRNKTIILTEEGKKIAEEMISALSEIEYNALNKVGDENVNKLIKIITMYAENLKLTNRG